jgi:SAM-dependent methyltransferase
VDLTCGTGFVTGQLADRTGGHVVGVDSSAGMLEIARRNQGEQCTFIQADAVEYLRSLPPHSVDVIICAWGLGYSRPWHMVYEIARVLRLGGRVGIIDNTLFSLAEVLWASCLAFAETPTALTHAMRVRFLPGSWSLALLMRAAGLAVRRAWDGSKTYHVPDGQAAIERLTATGAAAGFEFAAGPDDHEAVFDRFAQIMEEKYKSADGIPITHRYLAAIGCKP